MFKTLIIIYKNVFCFYNYSLLESGKEKFKFRLLIV